MINQDQLQELLVNDPLPQYDQLYRNSCMATCLDFLRFNGDHFFQDLWHNNRHVFCEFVVPPAGEGGGLNANPAPNGNEIRRFVTSPAFWDNLGADGFGIRVYSSPPLEAQQLEPNEYAQLVQGQVNASSIVFQYLPGGGGHHAGLYFRQWGGIFVPSRSQESGGQGSRVQPMQAGLLDTVEIDPQTNHFLFNQELAGVIVCFDP